MTTTHQHHQGATYIDVSPPSPSWPTASPPTAAAPVGDDDTAGGAGAVTPGGPITVAGAIVVFAAISIALVSLQYCYDAWHREESHHGAWSRPRLRRRRRRRGDGDGDGTAGSTSGGGVLRTRGVDPELLRALPVTVYRAAAAAAAAAAPGSSKHDDAAVECSVCLAELEDGEAARFLPRCGHGFHAECVDVWLASHTTCPLCRLTVSKPDPDESSRTPAPASALRPLPPEPAANLPGSVLLVVSVEAAVTMATGDGDDTAASASTGATTAPVIEIPELAPVPTGTPTPRDAVKSPSVSARPRAFRRLWSFGKQGTSSSSSCCAGDGEVADVERGVSVAVGVAVAEAQLPSEATGVRPAD